MHNHELHPPPLKPSPRRLLPWLTTAAVSVGALWLLAWLLVPMVLKSQLERHASEALGRAVTVESVRFSPWSLELELRGLRVAPATGNTEGTGQLTVQRIYVDAELSSLFRLAPVLDAVRIERPVLHLRHLGQGRHDWQDVLDRLSAPKDPPEPDTGPARLAAYNIQVTGGEVAVQDDSQGQQHALTDLELSVPFVNTLGVARDVHVQPRLAFKLNGSAFETSADTQPFSDSLSTEATLVFNGLNLDTYLPYLPRHLPVRPVQAVLGAELKVVFEQKAAPSVRITGHISADGVAIHDGHGQALLQLASARVELADVRPLEQVAMLGTVELAGPQLHLSRNAQGQWNVGATSATPATPPSPASTATAASDTAVAAAQKPGGWTVGVAQFKLSGGAATWADALTPDAQQRPARLALAPVDIQAKQLHWPLPTDAALAADMEATAQLTGAPQPAAKTSPKGKNAAPTGAPATLHLKGSLWANDAQATVGLSDLNLGLLAPYLRAGFTPTVQGQLSAEASAHWKPATAPARVDDLSLELSRLKLSDLRLLSPAGPEAASLASLEVRNALLRPLEHTANLGQITLTRPVLPVQRAADGQFMWAQWAKPPSTAAAAPDTRPADTSSTGAAPAWTWQLPELTVADGQVAWLDQVPSPSVALQTSALRLRVKGLASRGGPPAAVSASLRVAAGNTEPGTLDWQGSLNLGDDGQTPQVRGQLDARRLPAHALAPYAADQLNLALLRADTSFQGNLAFSAKPAGASVQVAGDATLDDFRANTMGTASDELLHWKSLYLKGLNVALAPDTAPQVSVQSGTLSDFFARIVIQPDGRINLQDLSKPAPANAPPTATVTQVPVGNAAPTPAQPASSAAPAARISIGPFSLVNGKVDFSDRFIRPNYQANLSDLTGRLGGFSSEGAAATTGSGGTTQPPQMAELELRGKAEGTASLEIVGKVNPLAKPLALDIEGRVRDLELPPLSPYTIKYTGHGIERGKLSLDVAYSVLPNGQLTARNQLVLNQLTFGEPVSGAPTSLPVKLATALLADRHGVIDLNLPISGSLNDPEFRLAPIIFKIIGNIIVKAVTAPFSLLTGILGGSDADLSHIGFLPGSARLDPANTARLERIAKAMADKPSLTLTVVGAASLEAERSAYQREQLLVMVQAELARSPSAAAPAAPMPAPTPLTDEDYRRGLTAVYKRTDMPKPRNALGMAKDVAPADMEALLLTQIPATDAQMQALAVQRGAAVRDHLVGLKVPVQRLFLGAPTTQPKRDGSGDWQPAAELKLGM